jgi:hypothetical protein
MIIRAYHGFSQPMGADLFSMLKTEGEKFLSSLAQPVQQQISQVLLPPVAQAPTTAQAPEVKSRALPVVQPIKNDNSALPPIAVILMLYLAWVLVGKK